MNGINNKRKFTTESNRVSNKTFKTYVDKMGGTAANTYIGIEGELFYDPTTTQLRISDGVTQGGNVFSANGVTTTWATLADKNNNNGPYGITLGQFAGQGGQGFASIAIGANTGGTGQGESSVAIGYNAGNSAQGNAAVSIGSSAGQTSQGTHAIAIGTDAGSTSQKSRAVAIGYLAGNSNQGTNSVAIGYYAGELNQGNNSIIINATGSDLQQTTANTFVVKPVRDGGAASGMAAAGFRPTYYNPTTGEFVYASS